jgi:hypothetical protein
LEEINDFDKSADTMKNILSSVKPEYVGPIDARIPDVMLKFVGGGGDESAFRSAVGRVTDQYRRLVTGAGASNQELARLESRLPKPTDTFENFKAKAADFIKEVDRAKGGYLSNLEKRGKNVADFKSPSLAQQATPVSSKRPPSDQEIDSMTEEQLRQYLGK